MKRRSWQMDGNNYAVKFIRHLKLEKLPDPVVKQAKICLLDLVGASLAGANTRGAKILLSFSTQQMNGLREATVIKANQKLPCAGAALVNGFIANALDIDDGYRKIKGHPGAAVFPAILAVSERMGATGKQFLEALVIGYEIAIRAGEVLHAHYGFYHGSGSWGAVASAAGAAKLLRLPERETKHALGIAEAFAPLVPEMRAVEFPSMAPKDGIPWGAMVGASAALLAEKGFTGIPSLLGDLKRNRDVFTLGKDFKMRKLYFKPYPCCRWAQPAIEGLLKLMINDKLNHRDISKVTIRSFSEAVRLCQTVPTSVEEAEYHVLFPVAIAAVYGEFTPKFLAETYFRDKKIIRFMKKISIVKDPKIQRQFPEKCLSEVEIVTNQGKKYRSGLIAARGDFDLPLSESELEDKFVQMTKELLTQKQMDSIIELVKNFEHHQVRDLIYFLK
jgi:2-methylcitrate dehydratase PrpD